MQKAPLRPPTTSYNGPSFITIPNGATTLSSDQLKDKIKGIVYGQAIGDAVGLACEFMTKEQAHELYGKYKYITYDVIRQDAHRSKWARGDWTDDTDQMILIIDMLLASGGKVDAADFAHRLKFWVAHGFPELYDTCGNGLGATVGGVVSQDDFEQDPHGCATRVWEQSLKQASPNGALMRTSILGVVDFPEMAKVIANTRAISKTTHADPRCTASCVFLTVALSLMLQGEPFSEDLLERAYFAGKLELMEEKDVQDYFNHTHAPNLQALSLDQKPGIGYTFKCLGAAVWSAKQEASFQEIINQVVMAAGDADTNAAVAGALLGCKLGYNALPSDWLNGLYNKAWLDAKVERFFQLLGL